MRAAPVPRSARGRAAAWLLFVGCASPAAPAAVPPALQEEAAPLAPQALRPVEYVLRWLRGESDRLAADMERLHRGLVERAREENPFLLTRLERDPPEPLPRGYGMLPKVLPDDPLQRLELRESTYSVEFSSRAYSLAFRDASVLAERAQNDPTLPLTWAVDEYERIRVRMNNLEDNLAYQEFWQPEVIANRSFFEAQNGTLERVRALRALRRSQPQDPAAIEALEGQVRAAIAPFYPTPGLRLEPPTEEGRPARLTVHVLTDIVDESFLGVFEEAVRAAWTEAEVARGLGLTVRLELERVDLAQLYPEGPPAAGAALDLGDHLARFDEGRLVLTTGAESTHSIVGRYIQIGVRDVKPRVLAHEFGHLLGFSDGYLRGFDGDPESPFGARIIEVTGLIDDLMGSPARGRTSEAMIEELLKAYGD